MSLMGDNGLFEPSLDKVIDFDGMFRFLIVFTWFFVRRYRSKQIPRQLGSTVSRPVMNVAGKHKWNIIGLILIKETGRGESILQLVFIKSLSIQKEIIGVISILTTVHLSTIIILHYLYYLVWCKFIGNGDSIYISKRL